MKTVNFPSYTIGSGTLKNLPDICRPLGSRLFAAGGNTALAKAMPGVSAALGGEFQLSEPFWYGGDCTYANITRVQAAISESGAQVVLGIGGGKAIDTAKAAADSLGLPFVSVPTISSTCAAVTLLSVVYGDDGVFDSFYFCKKPPVHAVIDTDIIAAAPDKYLRAGMGDAMAKHYECTASMAGDAPPYESLLGQAVSRSCVTPILTYGHQALAHCRENKATSALEQVVLASIVSTGLVSLLVEEEYNGAVAHSLFYSLAALPHIEEHYLHGDVVAYGVLVQMALLNHPELPTVHSFLRELGCPATLAQLELSPGDPRMHQVLSQVLTQPDMNHYPTPPTVADLQAAILTVEGL